MSISDLIYKDGFIYAPDFPRQNTLVQDLTPADKKAIKELGFLMPKASYEGPNLQDLLHYCRSKKIRKFYLLVSVTSLIEKYPVAAQGKLSDEELQRYFEIYTSYNILFERLLHHQIDPIHLNRIPLRVHRSRQILLIMLLLYWSKNTDLTLDSLFEDSVFVNYACFDPNAILKALQFYSKKTTSLRGGLVIPKLNNSQRAYFFRTLVNCAAGNGMWFWGASGDKFHCSPYQNSFVKDFPIWKRVFKYLNSFRYLKKSWKVRGAWRLQEFYCDPGYYKQYLAEHPTDLSKLLFDYFDGFESLNFWLDPNSEVLEVVGRIAGFEILHRFPRVLSDLEAKGLERSWARSCLFLILRECPVPKEEIIRGYEKHLHRARFGRKINGRQLPPGKSSLTSEDLAHFESFLSTLFTEKDLNFYEEKYFEVLISLKLITIEDAQKFRERYCQ